jgi:hypothetical protein
MSITKSDINYPIVVGVLIFIFLPLEAFALPKLLDGIGLSGGQTGGVVLTFVLATIAAIIIFAVMWWLSSQSQ